MSTRNVLNLYKLMLKEAEKFPSYNFRSYAVRRIKSSFKQNKHMTDTQEVANKLAEAQKTLEIIKRQVIIGQLYTAEKLVIENVQK